MSHDKEKDAPPVQEPWINFQINPGVLEKLVQAVADIMD